MARQSMDNETFAKKVKSFQRGFMGEPEEMRPGRGEFHEFPSSCICQKPHKDDGNEDDVIGRPKGLVESEDGGDTEGEERLQRLNKESRGQESISLEGDIEDELLAD
eukprot:TRINITY_DN11781_c0_g1_i1.p1 TRINITY_DN11781_c0_g1~~TRINITY_DN11781_c0_g1_i1.p1  ORF type:complete len:119 (+),score=27.80 TRINITY_DN11781_c0_g1_i1:37-357(+)